MSSILRIWEENEFDIFRTHLILLDSVLEANKKLSGLITSFN